MPSAHMDTHRQLKTKLLPCLFPLSTISLFPCSFSLSAQQCFIHSLSLPLWINRDTLSAHRTVVINAFSCSLQGWRRQAYHTSSSCTFPGKWIGDISHSGHVSVSISCKTIPKAECKLLCCTKKTENDKQGRRFSVNFVLVIGCCL